MSLRFTERHGSQHSPAGMRAPAFIEPSCEALTNGSAHPSSHLMGAKRLKEGESVYLAFPCTPEKAHYPPKPAAARKTDTCEMRATTFCSTASSTRAGMGDARLQGSRRALIPWLPEATTEGYCEYLFIHKKLNRPQEGKTKDFLI